MSLPDSANVTATNVSQIISYDTLHVNSVVAWTQGKTLPNTEIQEPLTAGSVPTLFGGNFQAVSVAQKTYGYVAGTFDFTAPVITALDFVDSSLGKVVDGLKAAGVYDDTVIFVCGKHGQTPIDPKLYRKISQHLIAPATGVNVSHVTSDDVALIWLENQADVDMAVSGLKKNMAQLQIQDIIYGEQLIRQGFGDPKTNPDTPDIIIVPESGVIYTTSTAKIAEHGGFSDDSTNVACFVSNPSIEGKTYTRKVSTRSVAPTILKVLGLSPDALQGAKKDDSEVLPGFGGSDSDDN